jgi:hypothetical protein
MKLFFEDIAYRPSLLDKYFGKRHVNAFTRSFDNGFTYILKGVGYCLSPGSFEHIFILPKNFVFPNGKAFGLLSISSEKPLEDTLSLRSLLEEKGWNKDLLTNLPLYLYQAIDRYRRQVLNSDIAEEDFSQNILSSKEGDNELTLLDISLDLQRFYQDNSSLFTMIYKQSHSGYNKVNWSKTVRKESPFIDEENIIYPLVINRKKAVNYDEELLVIFFNTLRHLNNKYQFKINLDQPYNLMSDSEFERKLDRGIILRRLKTIKNNYFNEKMVRLWNLLYAFTSKLSSIKKPGPNGDYLFVRNFESVFERMIDVLLSDSDAPQVLVHQKDNKEVDHLFRGQSITSDALDIYYIGDSKYYISGHRPQYTSLFKQYTYAKNIIQTEIDWFYSGSHEHLKYRDPLSEGYNLTPNFFISGKVEAGFGFEDDRLDMPRDFKGKPLPEAFQKSIQFPNRIFDRDTLFLMQFDVNVLFVISAYISRSQRVRTEFKKKAKAAFKREFIRSIEDNYDFYLLKVKDGNSLDRALNKHFRSLNGRIFCPYSPKHKHYGLLMMGLEKTDFNGNMDLILSVQQDFIVKEYHLGTEPYLYFSRLLDGIETPRTLVYKKGLEKTLKSYKQESVIVTSLPSEEDVYMAIDKKSIPIPLADLVSRCPDGKYQPIFTSAYVFVYCADKANRNVVGYVLTGNNTYDKESGVLYYEIDPMGIGSFELSQIISEQTKNTNVGPFFLTFEEAADSFCATE